MSTLRRSTPAEREEALAMLRAGASIAEVARTTRYTKGTISAWRRKARERSGPLTEDFLVQFYGARVLEAEEAFATDPSYLAEMLRDGFDIIRTGRRFAGRRRSRAAVKDRPVSWGRRTADPVHGRTQLPPHLKDKP